MLRDTCEEAAARRDERGQTMAEYAMVLAVITLAIMLTFMAIGDSAGALIDRVTAFL